MNKTSMIVVAVLAVALLVVSGCASGGSATGAAPYAPAAVPSGGGCGIGAPADSADSAIAAADSIDANAAL